MAKIFNPQTYKLTHISPPPRPNCGTKPECLKNVQIGEPLGFDEENWKTKSNYVQKVIFWPNLHEISGCPGNIKSDAHKIELWKFLQRINEKLLQVLVP